MYRMLKVKRFSVNAVLATAAMLFTIGCSQTNSNGTPETPVLVGTEKLAAYGVQPVSSIPVDRAGNSLHADYNPLLGKNTVLASHKKIAVFGLLNSINGSGTPGFVVNGTAAGSTSYGDLEYTDAAPTWIENPNASCAVDLDGDGIQEVATVVFTPSEPLKTGDNPGTVSLRILSKSGSYAVKTINLGSGYSLNLGNTARAHGAVSISCGDVNYDGKGDLAFAVGDFIQVISVSGTSYKNLLAKTNVQPALATTAERRVRAVLGDLNSDGLSDLVVSYGYRDTSTTAKYLLYLSDGTDLGSAPAASGDLATPSLINSRGSDGNIAVADLDGDGSAEVVFFGALLVDFNGDDQWVLGVYNFFKSDTETKLVYQTGYAGTCTWGQFDAPLKLLPYSETDGASGDLVVKHVIVANYASFTYKINSVPTLTKRDNLPYRTLYECMDVGDVNHDSVNEVVMVTGEGGQEQLAAFNFSVTTGSWTRINTSAVMYADYIEKYYPSFALADLDGETQVLAFDSHVVQYTDPKVEVVMSSVPYWDEYGPGDGSTEYGNSKATTNQDSHSFEVSAGLSIGYKLKTPLWASAAEQSFKVSVSAQVHGGFNTSNTIEIGRGFASNAGQDHVVFSTVPFDVYTYKVLRYYDRETKQLVVPSDSEPTYYVISTPRTPQLIPMERAAFNALPDNPCPVPDSVLNHTIGNPDKYPSKTDLIEMPNMVYFDSTGFPILASGDGSYPFSYTATSGSGWNVGAGASLDIEFETTALGATWGGSLGFAYDYDHSVTVDDSVSISVSYPYMPVGAPASKNYQTGLAFYRAMIPNTTQAALIINYWVD